jgi:hypothetical protein
MYDLQIYTLRSQALTGAEFLRAMGKMAEWSSSDDFETYTTRESHSCPLRLRSLPALDAFEVISSTFGVTIITKGHDLGCGDIFQSFTRRTHDLSLNHAWTTWYACENPMALNASEQDLSISAGLRKEGYFSGIDLFRPSLAISNIECRKELFDFAITAMGISNNIVTQIGDDVLYMRASLPWKLVYPSHQVPGGGNPLGFFACGFSGIDEALSAGQSLLTRFAKKVIGVSFVARLTGDGYKTVFLELDELWHPWSIDVMGTLTSEAINILNGGELSNTSPSRIPAFTSYRENELTTYGSVAIENGNRYLEITTDSGTLEQLQERVAFLKDVHFTPVFP